MKNWNFFFFVFAPLFYRRFSMYTCGRWSFFVFARFFLLFFFLLAENSHSNFFLNISGTRRTTGAIDVSHLTKGEKERESDGHPIQRVELSIRRHHNFLILFVFKENSIQWIWISRHAHRGPHHQKKKRGKIERKKNQVFSFFQNLKNEKGRRVHFCSSCGPAIKRSNDPCKRESHCKRSIQSGLLLLHARAINIWILLRLSIYRKKPKRN